MEPTVWIWGLLACAVISGFYRKTLLTAVLVTLGLLAAVFQERLSIIAIGGIAIGFLVAYFTAKQEGKWRYAGLSFMLIWSLALFAHAIPGFDNLQVLDKVYASLDSTPFTMYLNLDKPLVFFGLLLAYPALLGSNKTCNVKALALVVMGCLSLLPIAAGLGALKFSLSTPHWLWLFVLNNLLFTCVAEEALFRGFIQQGLSKRFGWVIGLVVASLLFGFAHIAGGMLLVVFAGLAGLCYGLAFYLTGRLWVAVLVHFMFNLTHLIFFTYPMLAK
ncbi:CAAX protease [Photobacterium angustum]|uniref:CPBP family intramembrane glutamic endopeptidase n=1 Tax=Photobacterium angustum TaxID=661 RepID=UPI0005DBEC29|nr:CPBP family intramembrane glutamic endopeptidase [Photobacterium angustum]KJF96082.1 CAAX protease [Photobacterium angustum]KJG06527.1 CAAX protease [Photobacterium angustum]PSV91522.1 CPBP family intramembrane metalloprotease [Photobacterium angustum]PSW82509.1 CPBP family intramembrane metalloprotease [Photobacterium angustum]